MNMWSKAVDTVDFKGDPYPDNIDAEGAGTVFILGQGDVVKTVSKSDYEQWLADTMGTAPKVLCDSYGDMAFEKNGASLPVLSLEVSFENRDEPYRHVGIRKETDARDHAGSCIRYNKAWHKKTGIPIEWIKGAGHNSNTDRPEQINRLIEAFLDKV